MKPETPNASHATPHFWREMQYEIRRRTFGKSISTPTESRHTTCLLGGKSLSVKLMSRRENKELAKTNLKNMGRTMQELQHIGSIALLFSPALSARAAKIFPLRGLNSPSESFPSVQHVKLRFIVCIFQLFGIQSNFLFCFVHYKKLSFYKYMIYVYPHWIESIQKSNKAR